MRKEFYMAAKIYMYDLKNIQKNIEEYNQNYQVKMDPLAYMEKKERREPPEMVKERYKIYQKVKNYIRIRKDLENEQDLRQSLMEHKVPPRYINQAIREVNLEEQRREEHFISEDQRERISLSLQILLESIAKEIERQKDQIERVQKLDHIRSEVEKAMQAGFSRKELTDIAVSSGIEQGVAEKLVNICVDEAEERWFARGEAREMDEYAEEELEMTHRF